MPGEEMPGEEKPGEEKPGIKKPSEKELGKPIAEPVKVPEEIPGTPVEVLQPKLVKGLGWLQILKIITNVVDSAAARIKAAPSDNSHETLSSELKKAGTVLAGIANDTIPGLTEIEEHMAELTSKLESIPDNDSATDKALKVSSAILEYQAQVELTIFENYFPGVPEVMNNYQKELAEYKSFKGNETALQKGERIALLVTKGTLNTLNDVMRDWVPGYQEAEDSVEKEAKTLYEKVLNKQESFWEVLKEGIIAPAKIVADTLHRAVQNYIPGEKQVESLIFGDGDDGKSQQPSETPPAEQVSPPNTEPSSKLSKPAREQWDLFLVNALDKEKAAECAQTKVGEEKKNGGADAKDGWKAKLPELTKQCYEEQFNDWRGKSDTGKRSLLA
ncbi:hypothetical protein HRG_003278 [Hirsutella rhossiliensis]|uniref:Uncharacterized protein n=1 Tax=Hirsutella rhossiliensis TaxID=111463 RepID=A0A9P8N5Z0_9HYPO|nr:uncharacterized protein HRG_03278 [Hirsutella rhossiliensis]KAH0965262.1 hypothetical protein HRG_03278 [Hirsutella rhossiliensis]